MHEKYKIIGIVSLLLAIIGIIGGIFTYDDRLAKNDDLVRIEKEFNKITDDLRLKDTVKEITEIKQIIATLEKNYGGENVPQAENWLKDIYIDLQIELEFKLKELDRIEQTNIR